jgi:hypothetical protein
LVRMEFDGGTVYLTDAPHDVEWDGHTWQSLFGMGTVSDIVETDSEVHGLQFTLSGVPTSSIALALTEEIQGRPVSMMLATLSGTTLSVDQNAWAGHLDVMSIGLEGNQATITVTAEHPLARWDQPNLLRFSHADQQRLHPGDMFFEYAERMADTTITWPAKEFFRK